MGSFCDKCGASLPSTGMRCPVCGTHPAEVKERKPRNLGPSLVLAGLLVLGMFAMLTVVNAPAVNRLVDAVASR